MRTGYAPTCKGRKTSAAEHHAVIHRNGGVPIYPHAVADVGLCLGRYSTVHGLAITKPSAG